MPHSNDSKNVDVDVHTNQPMSQGVNWCWIRILDLIILCGYGEE